MSRQYNNVVPRARLCSSLESLSEVTPYPTNATGQAIFSPSDTLAVTTDSDGSRIYKFRRIESTDGKIVVSYNAARNAITLGCTLASATITTFFQPENVVMTYPITDSGGKFFPTTVTKTVNTWDPSVGSMVYPTLSFNGEYVNASNPPVGKDTPGRVTGMMRVLAGNVTVYANVLDLAASASLKITIFIKDKNFVGTLTHPTTITSPTRVALTLTQVGTATSTQFATTSTQVTLTDPLYYGIVPVCIVCEHTTPVGAGTGLSANLLGFEFATS